MTDFKKILREAKLKVTPARLATLAALSKSSRPMTAEEIHVKVGKSGIDPVTIYRTLASFEAHTLVKRVDLHRDAVHFELADPHHHHIVCTSCGAMEDFDVCDVEAIGKKILRHSSNFKTIQEHSLELFGLCKKCMK